MVDRSGPAQAVFDRTDLAPAVAVTRSFATSPQEITAWVDVRPLDVPEQLLPEVKGFLRRSKRADAPTFSVIYVDPALGAGESVLNLDARGMEIAEALVVARVNAPPGAQVDGDRDGVIVTADVGGHPELLVRFGVEAIHALVPAWTGRFEIVGTDGLAMHGVNKWEP